MKYLLVFIFSILLYLICTPLRGIEDIGFVYATIIESVCYVVATYIISKKYITSRKELYLITGLIVLGRIILEIPIRVSSFESSLISLPSTLIACLSIILTLISFTIKRQSVYIVSLLIWGYCAFVGHKDLLFYINYGKTPHVQVTDLSINTSEGLYSFKDIKSDYILLSFWSSQCAYCHAEFSDIQHLHNKYKNSSITIASVFVPLAKNESALNGQSIITKNNYSFPVWYISPTDTLINVLNIKRYPIIVILDKKRNVIYRGNLERAEKRLEDINDLWN